MGFLLFLPFSENTLKFTPPWTQRGPSSRSREAARVNTITFTGSGNLAIALPPRTDTRGCRRTSLSESPAPRAGRRCLAGFRKRQRGIRDSAASNSRQQGIAGWGRSTLAGDSVARSRGFPRYPDQTKTLPVAQQSYPNGACDAGLALADAGARSWDEFSYIAIRIIMFALGG